MCYWYNLPDVSKCAYGLRVNLSGQKDISGFMNDSTDYYTNIPYLNESSTDYRNYYFVLDRLTIINALHKELIGFIIENCDKVYEDV